MSLSQRSGERHWRNSEFSSQNWAVMDCLYSFASDREKARSMEVGLEEIVNKACLRVK